MKEIKGKKYYVSLGFVDERKSQETIDVKDIRSILIKSDAEMYVDDTDKDAIVFIPLYPVSDIQRKGKVFKFNYIIDPLKIEYGNNVYNHLNVIGLFAVHNEGDGKQYIKHIEFYKTNVIKFSDKDNPLPIVIETDVDKILGE